MRHANRSAGQPQCPRGKMYTGIALKKMSFLSPSARTRICPAAETGRSAGTVPSRRTEYPKGGKEYRLPPLSRHNDDSFCCPGETYCLCHVGSGGRSPGGRAAALPDAPLYREASGARCSPPAKGISASKTVFGSPIPLTPAGSRAGVLGIVSGRGEIGRRAGFRFRWLCPWGFKSLRPHHVFIKS